MSPFRMLVNGPVVGRVGDNVASYFGDFGSLDGEISDIVAGRFLLELKVDRARRARLAEKLEWLEKRQQDLTIVDVRESARIVPQNAHSVLIFSDGTQQACFIIDMSLSGVAVSAEAQPDIGTPLAVGASVGRVIRHFREGFAVKFVDSVPARDLERLITRPMAYSAQERERIHAKV